jgi:hypothetical protein
MAIEVTRSRLARDAEGGGLTARFEPDWALSFGNAQHSRAPRGAGRDVRQSGGNDLGSGELMRQREVAGEGDAIRMSGLYMRIFTRAQSIGHRGCHLLETTPIPT